MIILDEIREKQGARTATRGRGFGRVAIPEKEEIIELEKVIPKDHIEPLMVLFL